MRDYKEKYQRKNFVSLCLSDQEMSEVDFFKKSSTVIAQCKVKLESLEDELLKLYQRWELLENLKT